MRYPSILGTKGNVDILFAIHQGKVKQVKKVPVHKLILGNISELEVDHISGDKMDNRRQNLRVCTHQQNMFNQNKRKTNNWYIGVCLHKCGRYEAYINVGGVKKYLGLFDTATDAAKARDQAAMIWFGDYARLNMEPRS